MILDKLTEFEDRSAAITGAAGTQAVGSLVDLGAAHRDIGNGQTVYAVIVVGVAPGGADTVKFEIASNSVEPLAADGTDSVHAATGDIAIASMPAGTVYVLPLASEGVVYERYLGLLVTNVGVGALTLLEVSAFLTLDPHGWQSYPDALPAFPA